MDTYLTALGWWNLIGSIFMLSLLNPSFGKKVFNEWTKIFKTEYEQGYWGRFWLAWVIGLNIFFALINIFSVHWGYEEIKKFCIICDLAAYSMFMGLAIWGIKAGRCGSGIYSVFVIFGIWIGWGIITLVK